MINYTKKLAFWFLMVSTFIGCWFLIKPMFKQSPAPILKNITLLKTPKPIPAFTLQDTRNQIVSEKTLKGHWNILFFGYPNCPDICPVTVAIVKQILEQYPQNQPPPFQFYFTNIDFELRSPTVLENFLSQFRSDFIGLTGDNQEILNLMNALGIHAFEDGKTQTGEKKIAHSGNLLLINPQGRLKAVISPPLDLESLFKELNQILEIPI